MTSTMQIILDESRRRLDEVDVALGYTLEWWERDQLEVERSRLLGIIEDAEVRLGYKHWVGYMGRRASLLERLRRWARKQVRRWR